MREGEGEHPKSELGEDANAIVCMKKLTIAEAEKVLGYGGIGKLANCDNKQTAQYSKLRMTELRKLDNGVN